MLSEYSQTQNAIYHIIPFLQMSGRDKSIETGRLVASRGQRNEEWGMSANGYELLFGVMKTLQN